MNLFIKAMICAASLLVTQTPASATITVIDFDRAPAVGAGGDATNDMSGHPGNAVIIRNLGAYARVTSIAYTLGVTSVDPTWLFEMSVWFGNSYDSWVKFTPGYQNIEPGTMQVEGVADLTAMNADFLLEDDGLLRVEFVNGFNPDGALTNTFSGSFTITSSAPVIPEGSAVPEPATWMMAIAGFGMIGGGLRRAKRRGGNQGRPHPQRALAVA